MPSRGVHDIQTKARGDDMKKDVRKAAGPKKSEKISVDVTKRGAGPMASRVAMPAGAPGSLGGMGAMGLKKGGSAKKPCSGYAQGGRTSTKAIDGIASKGHTKGRFV